MESISKHTATIDADIYRVSLWLAPFLKGLVWDASLMMDGIPYKGGRVQLKYHDMPAIGGAWNASITDSSADEVVTIWANDVRFSLDLAPKTLVTVECFHPALVPIYKHIIQEIERISVRDTKDATNRDSEVVKRAIGMIGAPVTTAMLEMFDPLLRQHESEQLVTPARLNAVQSSDQRPGRPIVGLTPAQRRRLKNISMDHDLKANDRDITRKEIARTLRVRSLRTVDSYLDTQCNRCNCAFCTSFAP